MCATLYSKVRGESNLLRFVGTYPPSLTDYSNKQKKMISLGACFCQTKPYYKAKESNGGTVFNGGIVNYGKKGN